MNHDHPAQHDRGATPMTMSLHSPDDLLAALPHMFGFEVHESLVLFPLGQSDLPRVRIDIPTTPHARDQAWNAVQHPYSRQAQPGFAVAIICLTEDAGNARRVSDHMRTRLGSLGIDTPLQLSADDHRWNDLTTGESGPRTQAARTRIAAEMVTNGVPRPARSRADFAASLVGDRKPISALLPSVRSELANNARRGEANWATDRLKQFQKNGNKLDDREATHLLLDLQNLHVRDALWDDIRTDTALSHVALWTDLTRRAPNEVRAAPATLLGFASWISGDGARTLCALDQVPEGRPYPMAVLLSRVIEIGLHPREWKQFTATPTPPSASSTVLHRLPPTGDPICPPEM